MVGSFISSNQIFRIKNTVYCSFMLTACTLSGAIAYTFHAHQGYFLLCYDLGGNLDISPDLIDLDLWVVDPDCYNKSNLIFILTLFLSMHLFL